MNKPLSFYTQRWAWVFLLGVILYAPNVLAQQKPDRSTLPELGPPPSLKLADIQHFQLSNGLSVVLMEKHEVPLVQVNLLVNAGSVNDPGDKRNLADITLSMMEEGAGRYNALALADAIDFLGASISTGAGYHTASVSLHTPLSKLDDALALMADVALRPTFPANELERLRVEYLTNLIQAHDEPNAIAPVIFNRTLYGEHHPYGEPKNAEAHLRAIQVEDLQSFYATYFRPNNATLVVVGDVTPSAIQEKLEQAFGIWKEGSVEVAQVTTVDQVKGRTIYLVDKPGAAQSVIRIGRIGAERLTEDYYALTVMNTILGGSFTSRLNQNLREDKGYSYGAGSGFAFRVTPGPFIASSSVQTDVTGPALGEFMKELNGMLEAVPEEELMRAKNYVALRYPRSFQTVSQVAGQLGQLVTYGLPDSYLNAYTDHIMAVTQADVQRVARQYLDPENLAIIVVGDREVVEEQIRSLDLGRIEVLSITDVLGKVPVMGEGL